MNRQRIQTDNSADGKVKDTPSALYDAALRHFRSGQLAAAEERCRKALSADPGQADCLHLLGLIHAATDRLEPGIELLAQAIRNNPANPEYFSNLGTLLQRQGKIDEAFKSYDLALKLKPDFVAVWIRLGDLLFQQKRRDESLLTYHHALSLDPDNADAAHKSGMLLLELKRYQEALSRFDLLQSLSPDRADAFYHLGFCLKALNRHEEAAASFQRSLDIDPRQDSAHNELGIALLELNRSDEAVSHFRAALEIRPDFADALNNLGIALKNLGRFDEALLSYDRAIMLKPDYTEAHNNRGNCLDTMRRADEALSSYRKALAVTPDYAAAHWNIAINRLRAGDFKTGWVESEWRWQCAALRLRNREFARPLWLGHEPIEQKRLLLHSDQGLGDALHFCRYVALVASRGAHVILEIDPPLRELVSSLIGVSSIIATGEALPDYDYHCPLGSLPLAFDTTLDTIPATVPYVSVGNNGPDWLTRLGAKKLPRIGLVWSGNPNHANDQNRSIALETLLPMLDVEAQFVSLQKDPRPGNATILRTRNDILDLGPELESFSDTAALLRHLDLLISVDTSVAHLAGALGRPAWVLLPYVPDWRWLLDREDSPWYPSLRLFRQTQTAEWPSVVQRVKAALQAFIVKREPC
jgi:tetratricopeptide (TPR) repeat protein